MAKLFWNVYRWDFNTRKVYAYNIFDHPRFNQDVQIMLLTDMPKDAFSKELRSFCMYYFWAKCEYETVVTSWPPYITRQEWERLGEEDVNVRTNVNLDVGKKIDIFDQLIMNWEAFVDYVYKER